MNFSKYATILIAALVSVALIAASRVIIDVGETVAYVVCAVCVGVSFALFVSTEFEKAYLASHLLAVSSVTLYQSHFVIEDVHALWQLKWFMLAVTVLVYLADYYAWYLVVSRAQLSGDARRWYGPFANLFLGAMAFIPLHSAGLFNLKQTHLLAVFAILHAGLGATEVQRGIHTVRLSTPHPALKCVPLLYLPPQFWPVMAVFLVANLYFVYRKRSLTDD